MLLYIELSGVIKYKKKKKHLYGLQYKEQLLYVSGLNVLEISLPTPV